MRIVSVAAQRMRWAIDPHGAARGAWHEREAIVLAVCADDGVAGLGEAAPLPGMSIDTLADAEHAIAELAARLPILIESPAHATGVADRIAAAPAARFAIETALLVAFAQHARMSVASLWGAIPHGELRCAVVVDDADDARAAVARGARHLKLKLGGAPFVDDVLRARRIAHAAPRAALRIDINRRWPRGEVVERLAALCGAIERIDYVEEPCPDAHELLAQPLPCRLALDESLVELAPAELATALASDQLAALVLKPTLLGGFARCFELAAAAHRHGVAPVVTHALEGAVGTAACIELARAIGADVAVGLAPHPARAA
jgi:o-succinylbenzoate synthase